MSDRITVLTVAAGLVSDGDNPEYDRAITEMTCELVGLSADHKDVVAALIGVQPAVIDQWNQIWTPPTSPEADPARRTGRRRDRGEQDASFVPGFES